MHSLCDILGRLSPNGIHLFSHAEEELGDKRDDILVLIYVAEGVNHQLCDELIPGIFEL